MRNNGFIGFLVGVLAAAICCYAGACTSKGFTKPRSQIISEAQNAGVPLPPIEVETERFYQYEKDQEQRMLNLIRSRANSSIRDTRYVLGAGDELEIHVFDVPELDGTVRILPSGFISLPLIGSMEAAGLTEQELTQQLRGKLRNFVKQPEISIFISHYGSQKVAVLGAVRKPGTYSLKKGGNSILELLSLAGGVSDKAGNYVNFVPAETSGLGAANEVEARAQLALASYENEDFKNRAIEMALDKVLGTAGGIPLEIPVRGGDMLIVPEGGMVSVEGEVEKTGSFTLVNGMTLLSALNAAGGINYSAKVDEVELIRDPGFGDKLHLVVNLEGMMAGQERDLRLKNGDIVRVPSDSGRRMRRDTFEGITRIINFGIGGSINMGP